MRLCEKCGFDANRDTASFCARCGQPLGNDAPPPEGTSVLGNHVQVLESASIAYRQAAPPASATPAPGQTLLPTDATLQERYHVIRVLGKGGMGAVYLVEDLKLYGKQWALKELLERFMNQAERAEAVAQFQREVQILVSLRHPNLPQVVNAFESAGRHYLVMEFIEGQTLEELIQTAPEGRLPEKQALAWAAQICDVLDYLHGHEPPVIFRDLKPANVMITPQGQVKLIDFGVARLFDPNKGTDTLRMGTVGYAPPEQYSGQGQTTPRSDVYALGATLYELLSGDNPEAHPFVFSPLRRLNRQVSAHAAHAIDKAVQLDPNDRFPSARAMKAALLKQKRGRALPALLVGLPLLLALAAGGGWAWQNGLWNAPQPTPTSASIAVAQATPSNTPTRRPTSTPEFTIGPPTPTIPPTDTPPPTPTSTPNPTPSLAPSPTPSVTPQGDSQPPTSTPAGTSQPITPSPLPPPPPGEMGRIFYTIQAGNAYYLGSTDPSWSQGQIVGPMDYAHSTCAGGSTAQTLQGQVVNLYYGYRCGIGSPKDCPSPDGKYKVDFWWTKEAGYSVSIHLATDDSLVEATYTGSLNEQVPLLWSPDSTYFYFAIHDTLHRASPYSAGYEPVIPLAQEPYLSPDGSMILYKQPVGTIGAYDFWVANADGSNAHNVTNTAETYKLCARWGY